jgi:hypothetical protein
MNNMVSFHRGKTVPNQGIMEEDCSSLKLRKKTKILPGKN